MPAAFAGTAHLRVIPFYQVLHHEIAAQQQQRALQIQHSSSSGSGGGGGGSSDDKADLCLDKAMPHTEAWMDDVRARNSNSKVIIKN